MLKLYFFFCYKASYDEIIGDKNDFAELSSFALIRIMWNFNNAVCRANIKENAVKILMQYPDNFKFDLILWDVNSGHCLLPFIERFGNPPVIGLSAFGLQHYIADTFGIQIPFIPFYHMKTDRMSFMERAENLFYTTAIIFWRKVLFLNKEIETAKTVFPDAKPLEEYEKHMSLILVNSDPIWDYAMPFAPNIIPVGGLHVKPPKKLPDDIKKILDQATNGVVYFAMGTNIKPEMFPVAKLQILLDAFSTLPFTILWKISPEKLRLTLPSNVVTRKWMPQNDILG